LDGETIEMSALKARVSSMLFDNPQLVMSVRTDRKSTYHNFVRILDNLKAGGATRISIASE
jgi:biopolymer transport protein ExbD